MIENKHRNLLSLLFKQIDNIQISLAPTGINSDRCTISSCLFPWRHGAQRDFMSQPYAGHEIYMLVIHLQARGRMIFSTEASGI